MVEDSEAVPDCNVTVVSQLGFLRTRRRAGLSELLPTLSSSVELEASTIGSSTFETRTEGTKRDLLGRSLEDDLEGLIKLLSCLLYLLLSRDFEHRGFVSNLLVFGTLSDVRGNSCRRLFGLIGSGCASSCVTRPLRSPGVTICWHGTHVVLCGFFSIGFPFSKKPLFSAIDTHFNSKGLEYMTP